jgi:hypothetical protein
MTHLHFAVHLKCNSLLTEQATKIISRKAIDENETWPA